MLPAERGTICRIRVEEAKEQSARISRVEQTSKQEPERGGQDTHSIEDPSSRRMGAASVEITTSQRPSGTKHQERIILCWRARGARWALGCRSRGTLQDGRGG